LNYWLLKSEPETFSIDALQKCSKATHCWDGVRNYQARNYMRDAMQVGDQAFFYHSSCKIPGIAGIVEIVSEKYPDHTAFDPESKYYDPKATVDNPRWFMRDVRLIKKVNKIITISQLRASNNLGEMVILRPGNRLSITPVTQQQWRTILELEKI